jgi:hypothetical protein
MNAGRPLDMQTKRLEGVVYTLFLKITSAIAALVRFLCPRCLPTTMQIDGN